MSICSFRRQLLPGAVAIVAACASISAQGRQFSLADAEQAALRAQPQIRSARLLADAADAAVAETRAPYFPVAAGNFTSVAAQAGTAVAAGALTTSSLADRVAVGVMGSQLVTDFGRTSNLVGAAADRRSARNEGVDAIRARVLLEVSRGYFDALAADAVLRVAQADLETRRLLLRQITTLAQSDLRSTLDVSFAEVAVSQAELALDRAQSQQQSTRARLAAAIGGNLPADVELVDESLPAALAGDPAPLIDEALRTRPDLRERELDRDAAARLATAERRLRLPVVTVQAAAGAIPAHDDRLHDTYGAAGVNVSVPVLNGGLLAARSAEAALRAQAAAADVEELRLEVARDVRVAWLESANAFKRLDVTARLVAQSATALRLAQSRYSLGLSSVIELTQAQFAETSAQMQAAAARYEYLATRALLSYQMGTLR